MSRKKWYDVTVVECYRATYKVRAEGMQEADDLVNELVNSEVVDPTSDCPESYERSTSVDEGERPTATCAAYWEYRDGRPYALEANHQKAKARKGKRR